MQVETKFGQICKITWLGCERVGAKGDRATLQFCNGAMGDVINIGQFCLVMRFARLQSIDDSCAHSIVMKVTGGWMSGKPTFVILLNVTMATLGQEIAEVAAARAWFERTYVGGLAVLGELFLELMMARINISTKISRK